MIETDQMGNKLIRIPAEWKPEAPPADKRLRHDVATVLENMSRAFNRHTHGLMGRRENGDE